MTHKLKTHDHFLSDIAKGRKPFEIRKDDRNFKVGEYLSLDGYYPESKCYSGREITAKITYKLENAEQFGLMPGYCILGIKVLNYNF